MMKERKLTMTPTQKKIIEAIDKVSEKLFEFKKKNNSGLVELQLKSGDFLRY